MPLKMQDFTRKIFQFQMEIYIYWDLMTSDIVKVSPKNFYFEFLINIEKIQCFSTKNIIVILTVFKHYLFIMMTNMYIFFQKMIFY